MRDKGMGDGKTENEGLGLMSEGNWGASEGR